MKNNLRLFTLVMILVLPVLTNAQWQTIYQFQDHVNEIKFFNINRGAVITGFNSLMVTNDGGVTFSTVLNNSSGFHSLHMTDSSNIYIVSGSKLFRSADFGTVWDSIMLPQPMNPVKMINDTLLFGKVSNTLLKSVNGGITWQTVIAQLPTIYFNFFFHNPDSGFVLTADSIYLTTNGGSMWTSMQKPVGYSICFVTDSIWYGSKGTLDDSLLIIKTTDRGNTWSGVIWQGYNFNGFFSVNFVNENVGYVTGFFLLQGTSNSGQTWYKHYTESPPNEFCDYVTGTHFLNADTGYAYDLCNYLYRTIKGTDTSSFVISISIADTMLYEPCGKTTMYIKLSNPAADTLAIHFDAMYGTATNGVDFMHIPDSVVFLPGMDMVQIPIMVIDDTLTEGAEFFTLVINSTLHNDTITIWINDHVPFPVTYQINPTERIVCGLSPNTSFTASISGGATPYSVTWYDTSGILSQHSTLPTQPILPWHRTIFVEITDNSICNPFIDSVKLYYFDSCKVTIHSSHTGQVPAGVPVTYSLVHDCPTTGTPNQWRINGQLLHSNTEQITHTWSNSGNNTVEVIMLHLCGQTGGLLNVPVITSVAEQEGATKINISQSEQRIWLITGEHLTGNLALRLMDFGGRMVSKHDLKTDCGMLNYTLDLHHLPAGMYLLDISSDNGLSFREKVVCR